MLPELKGKLDGYALRVPVPDRLGHRPDRHRRAADTSVDEVNAAYRAAADGPLKGS